MEYSATTTGCQTMEKISERLRIAIEHELDGKKRTSTLEATTGIAGETWRKFLSGKQNGTLVMLEAICKAWPEYAFWITTGIDDEEFGHTMPSDNSRSLHRTNIRTTSQKYFVELLKTTERPEHPDQSIRDALLVLQNLDLVALKSDEIDQFGRVDLLKKLRLISIFLDSYLLNFSIDEAIATFNHMRGNVKKLEQSADTIGEGELVNNLIKGFATVRNELEQRRDWIIERAAKEIKNGDLG